MSLTDKGSLNSSFPMRMILFLSLFNVFLHVASFQFSYWLSHWVFCLLLKVECWLSYYYCIIIDISPQIYSYLLYIFKCSKVEYIHIHNYILMVDWQLSHIMTLFCFLFVVLDLMFILSDISIGTHALIWFLFEWNIFFSSFTFSLWCVLTSKVNLL